jgi:peptide deformylase
MKLIDGNDPRLKEVSSDVDFDKDNPIELFDTLKSAMIECKTTGLSACQLGIMKRFFVVGNYEDPDSIIGMFNPLITDQSEDMITYEEACPSFPGLFLKIKRPKEIRIRYTKRDGDIDTFRFTGYTARVILHEYDHLNGILYQSRANRYHLDQGKKKLDKYNRFVKRMKNGEKGIR